MDEETRRRGAERIDVPAAAWYPAYVMAQERHCERLSVWLARCGACLSMDPVKLTTTTK
ncbi:MAG: hypothetical protein PHU43_01265 [Candidatus Bipolaricaulis sp.]|nr:hypothetical protein [Candidatus Bipolaricaulis sp.]